ncbi:MAG: acyl-CoA dehydratase activase [Candidatus Kapaibacterium sp.]
MRDNRSIGVCLGASTVKIVRINRIDGTIVIEDTASRLHNGDPKGTFINLLEKFNPDRLPTAITGRKFRHLVNLTRLSEPEATELALRNFVPDYKKYSAAASLGGETFMVYTLDKEKRISNVITKNQCASGTGEFYLQQIKRMGLSLDESSSIAEEAAPFKVSGRCSVFCKSDCTHALNKGVPKSEVTAGLALMIADKIEDLLRKTDGGKTLLLGGLTRNQKVMNFLRAKCPDTEVIPESMYFEALGAAYYALENRVVPISDFDKILVEKDYSFTFFKPLKIYKEKVSFKEIKKSPAISGDKYILGLDVGSTTTKAVLIGYDKPYLAASVYLYTNGDPIGASRKCYKELMKQVPEDIRISGIGTTGSGRHIAGLHAMTDGVINEIVAHANAAVHFDPEVDTIFEIGGQDAKYTYIVNKVPADYAMNEACSAGTGSFIEESAYESLGLKVTEIEDLAFAGKKPPNFSDQCAAFISSDIKTALQENIPREDVVAGLVYSICMNYVNRVKGNRAIGKKIFMQGGVCYNKAVPAAMAALTGADIIVPPEPGLMGAFGVALGIKEKIDIGLMDEGRFSLAELAAREVKYHKPFSCAGGKEKCDLGCSINVIEVKGKKYPFGGSCNKYYSLENGSVSSYSDYDYVHKRNKLMFEKYAPAVHLPEDASSIGINNSFHTHTIYPLFYNFFTKLGFRVILPQIVEDKGLEREITSFCYPSQLSLGLFQDLANHSPDYYFVPSILEMHTEKAEHHRLDFNCTCVFVSGEAHYLKQSFKEIPQDRIISDSLNFAYGWESQEKEFIAIAAKLGVSDNAAKKAYKHAVYMQKSFESELLELGKEILDILDNDPDQSAIVLIGRPYNSFAPHANKGIPRKFASRGVYTLPYDIFDFEAETVDDNMYWEGGKKILKAAKIVKRHPQLFATYISNFSCGPDSMILTTFRSLMGTKPSLTLELDGHTADAGINTRIDAALDIISNYRRISSNIKDTDYSSFRPAYIDQANGISFFCKSDGTKIPLNDPDNVILIPSMGDLAAPMFAAALRSIGFNAEPLPEAGYDTLRYGRSVASGKECLPLILLAGSLLDYIDNHWDGISNIAFFNIQGAGNCRLGQYPVFLRHMIKTQRLENVAQMILMNEDGFAGFGPDFAKRGMLAIIISDVMDDIRSAILAHAVDPDSGIIVFNEEFSKVVAATENFPDRIYQALEEFSLTISKKVPARKPISEAKYIALLGEIYVRRDGFSHKWLNKRFAEKGFIVKDAYISEWVFYVDYLLKIDLLEPEKSLKKKFERFIREFYIRGAENRIKKILEKSGYYKYHKTEIEPLLNASKHIIPLDFKGEPGLVLGVSIHESLEKYAGLINLGPFGCMPTRLTEACAVPEMKVSEKIKAKKAVDPKYELSEVFNGDMNIPFLTIETDGNVYPQVIEARLETFALQAERAAELMKEAAKQKKHFYNII